MLDHKGGFYFYRVNEKKIGLCSFSELNRFIYRMFDECPDDYFSSGPRSSSLKFLTENNVHHVKGHEVSLLAEHGLEANGERYKDNHSKVQIFMLENDDKTIAMEVPIWLESAELDEYISLFGCLEPLTGHIDILRIEDGKIWIWDYKPGAMKEKYAATQVLFYALMLSKRTGISLEKFRCGYFDATDAFIFKPEGLVKSEVGLRKFV